MRDLMSPYMRDRPLTIQNSPSYRLSRDRWAQPSFLNKPDYGLHVREEVAKWNLADETEEHFVEAQRKAGLDAPDKPPLTQ